MDKLTGNAILLGVALTASTALANSNYSSINPVLYSSVTIPVAGYTAYMTAQKRTSR